MSNTCHIYFHPVLAGLFEESNISIFRTFFRGIKIDDILYWNTKDEVYKICNILLNARLPFILISMDKVYYYRFGTEYKCEEYLYDECSLKYLNIEKLELSNEEKENLNYYQIMSNI